MTHRSSGSKGTASKDCLVGSIGKDGVNRPVSFAGSSPQLSKERCVHRECDPTVPPAQTGSGSHPSRPAVMTSLCAVLPSSRAHASLSDAHNSPVGVTQAQSS